MAPNIHFLRINSGLDAELNGRYVLTGVTHALDADHGFTSELDTAPPPPPARARGTVVAVGEVRRTDDPDELGRVRVSLPTYSDAETDWMGVVVAGGGSGKGMIALPYTFLTPGGQRVRLDDAKKSLRLENSEGSCMELTPDELVLHAETDLRIEAPGRSVAIRGAAINFERA